MVTALACPACYQVERRTISAHQLEPAALNCPDCGVPRLLTSTHRIDQGTAFLALPLAQVGIPAGHILMARCGEALVYLELSGDLPASPRPQKLVESPGGNP